MRSEKFFYKSPIGLLEIIYENNSIVLLKFADVITASDTNTYFPEKIKTQLDEYFMGKRKSFDIKINPKGTEFQKKVWQELSKIPFGKTESYSDIAKKIGQPNAWRAVGSACNKNPVMIIIPCHRVISKSGNLAGYAYGTELKARLLEFERS